MIEPQTNISNLKDQKLSGSDSKSYAPKQKENNGFDNDLEYSKKKLQKKDNSSEEIFDPAACAFPWAAMQSIFIRSFGNKMNASDLDYEQRSGIGSEIKIDNIKNPSALQTDLNSEGNNKTPKESNSRDAKPDNLSQKIIQELFAKNKIMFLPFNAFIYFDDFIKTSSEKIADFDFKSLASRILDEAKLLKDGEKTTVTIDLKPEWLGNVILKISSEKGILTINIFANEKAKFELDQSISELEEAFKAANLNIANLQVSVGGQHQREKSNKEAFDANSISPFNFDLKEKKSPSSSVSVLEWKWVEGSIYSKV